MMGVRVRSSRSRRMRRTGRGRSGDADPRPFCRRISNARPPGPIRLTGALRAVMPMPPSCSLAVTERDAPVTKPDQLRDSSPWRRMLFYCGSCQSRHGAVMKRWGGPPHLGRCASCRRQSSCCRPSIEGVVAMPRQGRVADVVSGVTDVHSVALPTLLGRLSEISVRGLSEMYEPRSLSFPRTLREGAAKRGLVAQGMSVRYAAIAALGLSRLAEPARRGVLAGRDVGDLVPGILGLALAGRDPGATALSVWAAVEVAAATGPDVVLSQ